MLTDRQYLKPLYIIPFKYYIGLERIKKEELTQNYFTSQKEACLVDNEETNEDTVIIFK